VDLLGDERSGVTGALVLDHPNATAYCLPGLRPRIVVSSGAVDALSADELAAVLAHERAHLRARHDLVLFPFRVLCSSLPRSQALATMKESVGSLVEMAADDRAMRQCERGALARAICRLTTVDLPAGALSAAATCTTRRVERALEPHARAALVVLASSAATACVLTLPLAVLLGALGRG
jgi:beta-lactamase regulating signal transducer with metallopeptidase domain